MSGIKPAVYWRQNKDWQTWLGRTGKVIVSTTVRVAAPTQERLTPYSYALVDFGNEKHEFMGVGHEVLQSGDMVKCVLRKRGFGAKHELIEYGIKVQKINE